MPAGEVRLRIIEDTNGNGKWDGGNVVERLQPERAEMYINDAGEDLFVAKANWEMEIALDMTKIFAPITMESLIRILDDKEQSRLKKLEEEWRQKMLNQQNKGHDSGGSSGGFGGGGMGGFGGMGGMGGGLGGLMGGSTR